MPKQGLGPIDAMIGIHLRQSRMGTAMSGAMVGRAIGISQQQISKQERGISHVTVGQLKQLAELYGKTLIQMLEEIGLVEANRDGFEEPHAAPFLVEPPEPMSIDLTTLVNPLDRQHLLRHYIALKRRSARSPTTPIE